MGMVLRLDQVNGSMVDTVGGKAANLGSLLGARFPVPDGFCLTTAAYRRVVAGRLDDLVPQLERAGADELACLAAEARQRIVTAPVPAELVRALLEEYGELGRPPVAVRSSATAEDLAFASFAGQQDTYLNVIGDHALLDAVRRCWASLWTDRAVSYRTSAGIDHREVALAVVVQRMVQAAAAGVMFTANPVTGTRHQSVVDASPGLGEAVVSGAVNPDHFVVDTEVGSVVERRYGDKRVLVRSLAGGGTEQVDRAEASGEACLSDEQVVALAELGRRVEDHYGAPQDTEWALDDGGRLWLTQARPITTLYPQPDAAGRQGTRAYLCLTLAQGLTRPITPMGSAAFQLIGSSVAGVIGTPVPDPLAGPAGFQPLGQRVYVDITAALRNPLGRRGMLAVFTVMEARAAAVLGSLTTDLRFSLVPGTHLSAIRPVVRMLRRARVPQHALLGVVSPARARAAVADVERRLRADLDFPATCTPEQRLDRAQQLLGGTTFLLMPTIAGYALPGFVLLGLAARLLGDLVRPGDLQTVLRGLPHNVTTEMDLGLWSLTQQIRADPAAADAFLGADAGALVSRFRLGDLPAVAQQGLTTFLERYGHRAVAEIDLGMPRWKDDPTHLVGMILNYLRLDSAEHAPEAQFRQGIADAEAMVTSLVGRARERSAGRARLVAFALGRTRELAGLRESPKNCLVLALAALRQELATVGAELADRGSIEVADDVFFLDIAAARRGLAGEDLRGLVDERREAYRLELRRRHIPRVLLSDGTEPEAVAAASARPDGALVGSPASAGTVTGPARVVLDPVGAHLEPGEILVAPSTDPGWTPLFLTAGGLVMEMGGSNSHGAVVAREYGIPAVVGVPDATARITTGQLVTVDGAAGLVVPS